MANKEHLKILNEGVEAWNSWRKDNSGVVPNLSGADLCDVNLERVELYDVDLREAKFSGANLSRACLSGAILKQAQLFDTRLQFADLGAADLSGSYLNNARLSDARLDGADLSSADLHQADLRRTDLSNANLSGAGFTGTVLNRTKLNGANFEHARFLEAFFGDVDLSKAHGLESCMHGGPSCVDSRTIQRSMNIPMIFWRSCGIPDWQIASIKLYKQNLSHAEINDTTDEIFRLRSQRPIQLYSCFLSYSSKDRTFALQLHEDLDRAGVSLWFDEHDLRTGDRIRDTIDRAVRARDKLLLILSEASLASEWVENEVETALEEERLSPDRRSILFPIRLDDTVMKTELAWARMVRRDRHITDMSGWSNKASYRRGIERLLQDLRVER